MTDKPKPKLCGRNYSRAGSYTAKIIDGVAYCPSCNLPIKEH